MPENQPKPKNFEVGSTVYWLSISPPTDRRPQIVASIKKGTVHRIYESCLGKHERHYGVTRGHYNWKPDDNDHDESSQSTIPAKIAHHTYESAHKRATANLQAIIANYQHALENLI